MYLKDRFKEEDTQDLPSLHEMTNSRVSLSSNTIRKKIIYF